MLSKINGYNVIEIKGTVYKKVYVYVFVFNVFIYIVSK